MSHAVHCDVENEHRFVEEWQDQAALQTYFKVPASRQYAKMELGASAAEPPKLEVYEASRLSA